MMTSFKQYLLLVTTALMLLACTSDDSSPNASDMSTTTDAKTDNTIVPNTKVLAGLYFARLPCPDCGSVRVNLILEDNGDYDKTEEFTQNNDISFESGSWRIDKKSVILTPRDNQKNNNSTIRFFRIQSDNLILVKEDGTMYSNKASDYNFKKIK